VAPFTRILAEFVLGVLLPLAIDTPKISCPNTWHWAVISIVNMPGLIESETGTRQFSDKY
jgi:hypothetical protein